MKCNAILLAVVATCMALHAERFAITGARLIDGTGKEPTVATVLVNGERIEAVFPGEAPQGVRTVDAKGLTLMPGLFDVHTHLLASAGAGRADWGKILKTYLVSGVTTVVDLSTYPEQFEPMRRLLLSGAMPGPHVLMAARFSSPGGHGAEAGRGDFHTQLVQTPEEARAAVRRILPYQPDVLKVFTDGWRYGTAADMTSMDEATLAALVDEAHKNRIKVVTHTVTLEKAKIAARAGVDMLIHGVGNAQLDEEALSLMKEHGTGYSQTMATYQARADRDYANPFLRLVLTPGVLKEAMEGRKTPASAPMVRRWANLNANAKLFELAGLQQSLGTDAGMPGTYHGWASLHELELMVGAGLTPLQAIRAGTWGAAKSLGLDADRGSIAEGRRADLLLVDGDPSRKIGDVFKVKRVWKDGAEVDLAALTKAVAATEPTPMQARKAPVLLDDFEDVRSRLGTLWINNTDGGHDHSLMSYARTLRDDGSHALTVLCQASEKKTAECSMVLPMAPGSVEPVDASEFTGVEFEARGEGPCELAGVTRGPSFRLPFEAGPKWKTVRVPLDKARRSELLQLEFAIRRGPGVKGWLELDNVRLYK
ncbi:MAG: amidohydrolase family protein [Bryobacteraceae bacterium]|nr:amidohydrolase family protein [Bryobacteraceae bacterium]